jgi:hypothetical protein
MTDSTLVVPSNEELLSVLDNCSRYSQSKAALIELLKDGFFHMAMARKSGSRYSVEDARQEFSASAVIQVDQSNRESKLYVQDCDKGAITISGMPHRNLRLAQARFTSALQVYRIMVNCSFVESDRFRFPGNRGASERESEYNESRCMRLLCSATVNNQAGKCLLISNYIHLTTSQLEGYG